MSGEPRFREAPEALVVTGAAGWLGRALLNAVSSRDDPQLPRFGRVRALVNHPSDVPLVLAAAPGAEVLIGDVTDPSTIGELIGGVENADVVHAAGVIHPSSFAQFESVNAGGTKAVVDGAAKAGARRLVHVSSNSPFGCNPASDDLFRPDEPFNPYMEYGRSKMLAEIAVRDAPDSLETVVIRPPWFYGPFQPARQTRFFSSIRSGRFPIFGDGTNRRSMVNVESLANAVLRASLAEGVDGNAYWIADARPYEMKSVIETVREALADEGYEVKGSIPRFPSAIADAARAADAALQARRRYVQEIHVLSEMNQTIACDVSEAERDLGYAAQQELLPGMRRAVAWCRDNGITV